MQRGDLKCVNCGDCHFRTPLLVSSERGVVVLGPNNTEWLLFRRAINQIINIQSLDVKSKVRGYVKAQTENPMPCSDWGCMCNRTVTDCRAMATAVELPHCEFKIKVRHSTASCTLIMCKCASNSRCNDESNVVGESPFAGL